MASLIISLNARIKVNAIASLVAVNVSAILLAMLVSAPSARTVVLAMVFVKVCEDLRKSTL
jgi:hypothetical protein